MKKVTKRSLKTTRLPQIQDFKPNVLALAITAAISSTAATTVNAQELALKELPTAQAQAQTEDSYKVNQSTSHKYTQPLLDTAKTITVIPESVMKDRGVESLRDALRNVSGISLAAGEGGTPTGDSMTIRGFDARTDIFVDGVRDIAGYPRDTYNLEAVEIAKGPGSAVSGRGSTGGSINLQSKTAKLEEITDVGLRLGTESDYRTTLDANIQMGASTALRINLLADDGEVAGRDQVANSKSAFAISLATGLGTHSRFTINAESQSQDNLPDYGIPWVSNSATSDPVAELAAYEGKAPPISYSNFYGNVHRDYEDIEAKSVTVKYEYDISEAIILRAQARTGSVNRESIVSAPRFLDLTSSTDVRLSDEKTRDTENSLNVLQVDLIGRYQTGSVTHDIVFGLESATENEKRWNFIDLIDDNLDSTPEVIDLYNPDPFVAFTGRYGRDGTRIEAEGKTKAVYLFDTMTLNPQWELTVGFRSEKFKTDYQYDYQDPSQIAHTSDNVSSWSFATVYKPTESGSIYFGAGNSFNPSAEDLTVGVRTDGTSNAETLAPEETLSYEVGTKWELLDGKLMLNAALFQTEKTNALTDDPLFASDSAQSRFVTLNGKQKVEGLEFSTSGQLTDQWLLIAAYTYQKSEVTHAEGDDANQIGQPLPRTPEHSFSLWNRYNFNDQWVGGFGAQYIDERTNNTDPLGLEVADSYLTFDMMLSYQVNDQFGVQLNGTNLTDETYEEQLGGGHFIPGHGRYMRINLSYSFK